MEVAVLFGLVIGLMLIGVPIAVSLGMSSILFLLVLSDTSLASIAQTLFQAMAGHYTLLAIPFFILASTFMSTGGVAQRIIRFSIAVVGHFPGGLAIAGVFACMMFAALSGSSPATVVAIGSIVIAGMTQVGYTKDFAAGVIANAGTLGILIPPSIVMVVYASATDVSVGRMFLAGVIPGLMAGSMLMITIYAMAKIKNLPKGEWLGWGEVGASAAAASGGLFLIVIILGGIYGGIFTPTEAAAVAAVYSFLIASYIYRDMGPFAKVPPRAGNFTGITLMGGLGVGIVIWLASGGAMDLTLSVLVGFGVAAVLAVIERVARGLDLNPVAIGSDLIRMPLAFVHRDTKHAFFEAGKLTITLMFIIANALILKHVLTDEQIPQQIAGAMLDAGFGPVVFLIIVNVILLIGGQFMEPSGLLVIVAPLVFPIAIELGIDPIHLGIIMVVNMEIGMITPPVGLNLFVTSGVAGMPMMRVVKAALPFLAVLFVFLIMVTYIPAISIWLPTLMMGPEIIVR
ncbi:TRAP transporter large permease [uncultured Tateyamaria sp.]|uniref:TRAP transporter large permease n=1 Tax=uncultured Tateyamaria sp. TaxID=455651 RepID=UPI00262D0B15|nr:TRAP transporter large permease [uncultured Tateyamaria sp.]